MSPVDGSGDNPVEELLKRHGLATETIEAVRAVMRDGETDNGGDVNELLRVVAGFLGGFPRDDGTLGWGPFTGDNVRNAQLLLGAVLK